MRAKVSWSSLNANPQDWPSIYECSKATLSQWCKVARFLLTRGNHLPNFAFLKTSPFFGLKKQKNTKFNKKRSKETKFTKKIYQKEKKPKTIKVVKKPNLQMLVWKNQSGNSGLMPAWCLFYLCLQLPWLSWRFGESSPVRQIAGFFLANVPPSCPFPLFPRQKTHDSNLALCISLVAAAAAAAGCCASLYMGSKNCPEPPWRIVYAPSTHEAACMHWLGRTGSLSPRGLQASACVYSVQPHFEDRLLPPKLPWFFPPVPTSV